MVSHATFRSTVWSSLFLGLVIALLAAPLAAAAPAAPDAVLIVDDFSTVQGKLIATLGSPAASSVSGGGILGNERDMRTTVTADVVGGGSASSEVINHALSHSQDSGVIGNTLVQWDGTDGSINLNPTGLGGVDLTQGHTQNGLQIEVILNDLPIDLIFTVYSSSGSSQQTLTLPGGQPSGAGPKYYYLEYASFSPVSGTGADFTSVGAIEMLIDGYNDATDLTIHDIRTAAFDWGDLPDASTGAYSYPTRFVDDGPRHLIGDLFLGAVVDSTEIDGVPTVGADGDDVLPPAVDDEDGVVRTPGVNWQPGANGGSIDVTVTGGNGCLAGWIDWTQDGDLTDAGENIFNGQPVTAGTQTLTFAIPVDPFSQSYYARFRLFAPEANGSCLTNRLPTGRAINGEVEDYVWGFGPNAVHLNGFAATSAGLPWAVGLVLPVGVAAVGATRAIRRRK